MVLPVAHIITIINTMSPITTPSHRLTKIYSIGYFSVINSISIKTNILNHELCNVINTKYIHNERKVFSTDFNVSLLILTDLSINLIKINKR